jgi:predicted Zn-dependent peptidase
MNHHHISLIQTDKFKDTQISIRFLGDNAEPNITQRALLAYVLMDRFEAYPTKQAVNLKTDDLFALSFDVKVASYGSLHAIEYRMTTLSERFSGESHLEEAINFAASCLKAPLISLETLQEAKTNLKAALLRIYDKPSHQALISAMRLGGEGEPLANFSQGTPELIDKITLEMLKETHHRMLVEDAVFVIGVGEFNEAHRKLLQFHFPQPTEIRSPASPIRIKPFRSSEESKAVKQTALVRLYATSRTNADPDYAPFRVMTYLLGQLPNSLLFTEVREKRNLCYSIYSSLMHFDGAMMVSTGISADQIDAVIDLIEQQLKRLIKADYPQELLESAKSLLISNYKGLKDDVIAWMNVEFSAWLNMKTFNLDQICAQIAEVSAEDVTRAAQELVPISQAIVKGVA